jgi:ectoine hydroxylase-related dioxygenase (phytanoyl-CoA dioxygenase family)
MLGALIDEEVKQLVDGYRQTGYLILRNAFDAYEVDAWKAECERLSADKSIVNANNRRTPFGSNAKVNPERIDPVIDISPVFKSLANDRRITNIVREIFDGHEPCIWKDKIIYKDPGVKGYPIHQDASWWQGLDVPPTALLSVMIAIDGAAVDNGCLEVFPGYHHTLLSTVGETRNMNAEESKAIDRSTGVMAETQPGDVIIFHALTPHQSAENTSPRGRRQFYLTYNDGQFGDHYQRQQTHYRAYTSRGLTEEQKQTLYWK